MTVKVKSKITKTILYRKSTLGPFIKILQNTFEKYLQNKFFKGNNNQKFGQMTDGKQENLGKMIKNCENFGFFRTKLFGLKNEYIKQKKKTEIRRYI